MAGESSNQLELKLIDNAITEIDATLDGRGDDEALDYSLHELRGFYFGEQAIVDMKRRYGVRLSRAELDAELQQFQQGRSNGG